MRYTTVTAALLASLAMAPAASAQDAPSLVGNGTHAKGNGDGPDGLGAPAPRGTTGDTGAKAAPSVLGGNTSTLAGTPLKTTTPEQGGSAASPSLSGSTTAGTGVAR